MDWESESHGNNEFHCNKGQVDACEPVGRPPLYMILNHQLHFLLAVSADSRRGGGGRGARGQYSRLLILIYGVLPPDLVLLT